ncbi:MAG: phosphonate C-P lyase system protein PhnH [Enterococcus sp.]
MDIFDIQASFRQLVNSLSYVGEMGELPSGKTAFPIATNLSVLATTLLDQEVTYSLVNFTQSEQEYLQTASRSSLVAVADADYVFLRLADSFEKAPLTNLKIGTLVDPQTSATVFIFCESLVGDKRQTYQLSGPGIQGEKTIALPREVQSFLALRNELNQEYPLGIDVFLVDDSQKLIGLPRTTQIKEVNN